MSDESKYKMFNISEIIIDYKFETIVISTVLHLLQKFFS